MKEQIRKTKEKIVQGSANTQVVISQLRERMKMNTFIVNLLIALIVLLMAIIVWLIWR